MAYLLKANSNAAAKPLGNEVGDLQPFVSFSFMVAIQWYPFLVKNCGSLYANQIIPSNFGNIGDALTSWKLKSFVLSARRVYFKRLRQRAQIMLVDGFNSLSLKFKKLILVTDSHTVLTQLMIFFIVATHIARQSIGIVNDNQDFDHSWDLIVKGFNCYN